MRPTAASWGSGSTPRSASLRGRPLGTGGLLEGERGWGRLRITPCMPVGLRPGCRIPFHNMKTTHPLHGLGSSVLLPFLVLLWVVCRGEAQCPTIFRRMFSWCLHQENLSAPAQDWRGRGHNLILHHCLRPRYRSNQVRPVLCMAQAGLASTIPGCSERCCPTPAVSKARVLGKIVHSHVLRL